MQDVIIEDRCMKTWRIFQHYSNNTPQSGNNCLFGGIVNGVRICIGRKEGQFYGIDVLFGFKLE